MKYFEPRFDFPELVGTKIGGVFHLSQLPEEVDYLILNFYAPDCPPCIEELPELEKLYLEISSPRKDVHFLGIASTLDSISKETDPPPVTKGNSFEPLIDSIFRFKTRYRLKYKIYLADTKILRSFRITGFPETMIFKREGKSFILIRKFISAIKLEDIKKYTEESLPQASSKRTKDNQNNDYN